MSHGGFSYTLVTHCLLPPTNFKNASKLKFIKTDEYEDEAREMTLFRRILAEERVENLKEDIPDCFYLTLHLHLPRYPRVSEYLREF